MLPCSLIKWVKAVIAVWTDLWHVCSGGRLGLNIFFILEKWLENRAKPYTCMNLSHTHTVYKDREERKCTMDENNTNLRRHRLSKTDRTTEPQEKEWTGQDVTEIHLTRAVLQLYLAESVCKTKAKICNIFRGVLKKAKNELFCRCKQLFYEVVLYFLVLSWCICLYL